MNIYNNRALDHFSLINPEQNFFTYHNNAAYTSRRTKQNRVYAFVLQKLYLLKHFNENLSETMSLLLKSLIQQYFYENNFGNKKLSDEIIYFASRICQDLQIIDHFSLPKTPHKIKFQLWLQKIAILPDEQIIQEVEMKSYDTEYLNTKEYQVISSYINQSPIDYDSMQSAQTLLKFIELIEDQEEQYKILKQYKDSYMQDSYLLKIAYLKQTLILDKPIFISDLERISNLDMYDSQLQLMIIQGFIKLQQVQKALDQLVNHILTVNPSIEIWQQMLQFINNGEQITDQDIIKELYFTRELLYEISVKDPRAIIKLQILRFIDQPLFDKYNTFI